MSAIKIDLTNSERLCLLRFINEEVRKCQNSANVTIPKLELIYGIQRKLGGKN